MHVFNGNNVPTFKFISHVPTASVSGNTLLRVRYFIPSGVDKASDTALELSQLKLKSDAHRKMTKCLSILFCRSLWRLGVSVISVLGRRLRYFDTASPKTYTMYLSVS